MIIKSVRVENFRCIKDETLHCDHLTAMVGPNGSGKSTFLNALRIFYQPNSKLVIDDFYDRGTENPIIITVTFSELTPSERNDLQHHMDGDEFIMKKEMPWSDSKQTSKYFGKSPQCRDFDAFRNANERDAKKAEYDRLKATSHPDLGDLRSNASVKAMEECLEGWEQDNPDNLVLQWDGGDVFGFGGVGKIGLEKYTRFLYIPSNYDASVESVDGKGTLMQELMDIVVRNRLEGNEEFREFEKKVEENYRLLLDPTKTPELGSLEEDLTSTLGTFAPGTELKLTWSEIGAINLPIPTARIHLMEDGYETELERSGDGVKRAFILAALQRLEAAKAQTEEERSDHSKLPSLILGIEEPELYQHPTRERHIAKVLLELARSDIGGVAERTQVIYTTHSPLMVDLTRFDQVRVVKKVENGAEKPRMSKVYSSSMEKVVRTMEEINSDKKIRIK